MNCKEIKLILKKMHPNKVRELKNLVWFIAIADLRDTDQSLCEPSELAYHWWKAHEEKEKE